MRIRRALAFGALGLVPVVAAVAAVIAVERPSTAAGSEPLPSPSAVAPITFTTAGDSLTALPNTWWSRWDSASVVKSEPGGYAHTGYTSGQVLAEIPPVRSDVLVLMLGTNDVRLGVRTSTTLANLQAIVRKEDARRVVVAATPPSDLTSCPGAGSCPLGQSALNRALEDEAAAHGWLYVDPWSRFREPDGRWTPGADVDGRHPTTATGDVVRQRMEQAIRVAYRGLQ